MITKHEIEKKRTPAELRDFVRQIREKVDRDKNELKRAKRKTGLYKPFVDEVMALSTCADQICANDDTILPVLGNQGYDAIVFDASGKVKERIEIAKPFDGKAEAVDVRLSEERGWGKMRIRDLGEGLKELAPYIHKTAAAKAMKDYSDCTVLLVAPIDPPFNQELPALAVSANELCAELKKYEFHARRVILAVPPLQQVFLVQSN